jgi:hypothetical protein
MSTKNLARTVIEGGRNRANKWFRHYSNHQDRAQAHEALARLRQDPDAEELALPRRKPVSPWFRDKLGPPERWLERNVGRPWSKVRAELFARFDTRTTAGRHIVFCHVLPWIETPPGCLHRFGCGTKFRVDRHGILRRIPQNRN